MSDDDTRNTPNEDKPVNVNLFGDNSDIYDPNPTREELGADGDVDDTIDFEAEAPDPTKAGAKPESAETDNGTESSETETVEYNEAAESVPGEAPDSKQPDKFSSAPVNDSLYHPANTAFTQAKASELRKLARMEPNLVGRDANLLKYNPDTKQHEPKDENAEAMLTAMGTEADIKIGRLVSNVALPMMWDAENGGLVKNPNGEPVMLARSKEDRERIKMYGQETPSEKITRAVRQRRAQSDQPDDAKSEQERRDLERKLAEGSKENKEQEPMTAGVMAMSMVGSALSKMYEALKKLVAWVGQKIGAGTKMAMAAGQKKYGQWQEKKQNKNLSEELGASEKSTPEGTFSEKELEEINKNISQNHRSNPLTPGEVSNASKSMGSKTLAGRISGRIQEVLNQSTQSVERIVETHKQQVNDGLQAIETGMHLNEVGQIPLVSQEDFENRARTADPEDRKRITSGVQTLANGTRAFREQTQEFANSELAKGLKPEDQEKLYTKLLDQGAGFDRNLDPHQKKILEHASVQKSGVKAKLANMFAGTQSILETRMHQANQEAQKTHRQAEASQTAGQDGEQIQSPG